MNNNNNNNNNNNRKITAIIIFLIGVILTIIGFFTPSILIYGIPLIIIGVGIYLNKKEDEIEKIKKIR